MLVLGLALGMTSTITHGRPVTSGAITPRTGTDGNIEYHVDPVSGNDDAGDGSLDSPLGRCTIYIEYLKSKPPTLNTTEQSTNDQPQIPLFRPRPLSVLATRSLI